MISRETLDKYQAQKIVASMSLLEACELMDYFLDGYKISPYKQKKIRDWTQQHLDNEPMPFFDELSPAIAPIILSIGRAYDSMRNNP